MERTLIKFNVKKLIIYVIIGIILYAGYSFFQLIKADNSGRITHLYDVTVTDKYTIKHGKSPTYYFEVGNSQVKNFSIAINKETWDNINIGEKYDIDYDLGWSSVNRLWKK